MFGAWGQRAGEGGTGWGSFHPGTGPRSGSKENMVIARGMVRDGRRRAGRRIVVAEDGTFQRI